jgi:hypothetical protein
MITIFGDLRQFSSKKNLLVLLYRVILVRFSTSTPEKRGWLPEGEEEDEESVSGIAEHDAEQEGEGDDGEDGWVHLLVVCHAVVVDQSLRWKNSCENIALIIDTYIHM